MRRLAILICLAILIGAPTINAETVIEWWQFWTDPGIKPTIDSMVAEFETANPDVTVNVTDLTWANGHEKIAIAFASNSAPDVVELGSDWVAQFAASGHLLDVSGKIANEKKDFDGWSMVTYKDGVYGWPWILGTRVIFANLDLMKRAGLNTEQLPIGLRELRNSVQAVHQLGPDVYGWGANTAEKHRLYKKFLPFLWSLNGHVLSPDGQYRVIASEEAISAMELYKQFHQQFGYVADQRGIEDAFLDGKIGFILSGDWLLKRIQLENRKINFATTIFPGIAAPGRVPTGTSFKGGEILCISSKTEHPEASLKLVKYITLPENQLRFCKANRSANPSSKVAQKDQYFQSDDNLRTFIAQLNFAEHPPVIPQWVELETEIEKAVEKVVFENANCANTLYETSQRFKEILAQ